MTEFPTFLPGRGGGCSARRGRLSTARSARAVVAVGWVALALAGCTQKPAEHALGFAFYEKSKEAGLDGFLHTDGSSGNYYITETLASGVALFDWDEDGDLDVYFLNGRPLPPSAENDRKTSNALYRNDGNLRFTDVTSQAGIPGVGFSVGCAIADYDNDGHQDIYIAGYGSNVLYRCLGPENGFRYEDVTEKAGVNDTRFSAHGCFADIDNDDDLDLYVSNYVVEAFVGAEPCLYNGVRGYCAPGQYEPVPDSLFENLGDGTFRDISESSGISTVDPCWGLSVIATDFNDDGLQDFFVANDRIDNFLFENLGNNKFRDVGLEKGAAVSIHGDEQGSMGIGFGDFDRDGHADLMVTNYQKQMNALYRATGTEGYHDSALAVGIGEFCLPLVSWGTGFYDFDHDGWQDLFVASGHLEDHIHEYDQSSTYLQQNQVFMNQKGRFVDLSGQAGPALEEWQSSRGAAFGDIDNDGDIDIVVSNSRARPSLLINDGGNRKSWIQLELRGNKNIYAIGARVKVHASGIVWLGEVHSTASYASQDDLRLHFGLGDLEKVDRVEIRWPTGKTSVVKDLKARQVHRINEP